MSNYRVGEEVTPVLCPRTAAVVCGVLLAIGATGCARLTIEQLTLQGDSARGRTTRVAIAKGLARGILEKLSIGETPAAASREKAALHAEAQRAAQSRVDVIVARLTQRKVLDPIPEKYTADREVNVALRDHLRQATNELFEFATQIERLDSWPPLSATMIDQIKADAREIKHVLKFPGFDQIHLYQDDWKPINPVHAFGGFGKAEFIVVRDDGGNYEMKSASFNPSQVIAAGVASTVGVMRMVARAYGVPLPAAGPPPATSPAAAVPPISYDPIATPALDAQTKHRREIARRLDAAAEVMRRSLTEVQEARLATAGGNLAAADADALKRDVRTIIETYRATVASLSRDLAPLAGLQARLPETSPLDRLAGLFGVGSLTQPQIVALFWAYRLNPTTADPREAQLITQTIPGLVAFDAAGRPEPRLGLSPAAVGSTLDDLNRAATLAKAVTATRANLKSVKDAWDEIEDVKKRYNVMVTEIQQVAANALQDIDQAAPEERTRRRAQLKQSVAKYRAVVGPAPTVPTERPLRQQVEKLAAHVGGSVRTTLRELQDRLRAAFDDYRGFLDRIDALPAQPSPTEFKNALQDAARGTLPRAETLSPQAPNVTTITLVR